MNKKHPYNTRTNIMLEIIQNQNLLDGNMCEKSRKNLHKNYMDTHGRIKNLIAQKTGRQKTEDKRMEERGTTW